MNYKAALEAYNKNKKSFTYSIPEIETILINDLKAFEIPLKNMSKTDLKNNEEVTYKNVFKMYVIEDQEVLNKFKDEFDDIGIDLDEDDNDYTADMKDKYDYDTLIVKHNEEHAMSVIIETKDKKNVSFLYVWGSIKLQELMYCYSRIKGMDEGNIDDPHFQTYLEILVKHGFIKDYN
ncbi:hypothetical protein [Macrococcus lamae]|uniref:Uncharacterized protein n=1 Tax=Macrococcus lamae TaxID=198484 RepID=A0A4R6BXB0_9STAP|nr:hypothetical protein [Macrococcus lamae]TDM12883.1 hypothetical protein ERX29_02455 [Macrococcus lamae]